VQRFLQPFEIISYNAEISQTYAELRTYTESSGKTVGPNDLIIASIVVAKNGILITRNAREFSQIPKLKQETW